MPMPSLICAKAASIMPMTRSETVLVATEHEVGWRGMPTTQFSRTSTLMRRKVPALLGTMVCLASRLELMTAKTAATPELMAVD